MIHGIQIKLISKTQIGIDEFNHPKYEETISYVDNVLVSPTSAEDLPSKINLDGKKQIYTLGIPKGDNHIWVDQDVEFFGKRYHVFTSIIQGIEDMIPGKWHKKVMVESYD